MTQQVRAHVGCGGYGEEESKPDAGSHRQSKRGIQDGEGAMVTNGRLVTYRGIDQRAYIKGNENQVSHC